MADGTEPESLTLLNPALSDAKVADLLLLKEEERADLERVLAADACLDACYKLVQRFRSALHDLDVTAFKQWLFDAAGSDLKPFARLAAGMTDDLEAITNAFRYPWSAGPVEGHIKSS